ncbi:MAG TPA: site-specific integrase, partial [Candidatus Binatia bacterium]
THELSFLRRVFSLAIRDGLVETNPVRGLVKKPSNERLRYLTEEEESRLHAELKPDEWDLVEFAIQTGLRQGEHFGLKWPWIEIQADVLRVPTSKGGAPRTVPLTVTAIAILRNQPRMLRCQWVWPTRSRKGGATPGRNHRNARNFCRRVFVPALKRAEIEDFTWHDLRHTFASRLAMESVDIRTIKELMGHKRIEMTMRYAHLAPSHLHDAVKHLDGYAERSAKRRKRANDGGRSGTRSGTDYAGPR